MKKFIIITLLILAINPYTFGQVKLKSEPIETGYVFIDGEYVEAPYIIEVRNNILLINNKPISRDFSIKDKKKSIPNYLPEIPATLHRNSDITEIVKERDKSGQKIITVICNYYHTRYEEHQAQDSIITYLNEFPNVKSSTLTGAYRLDIQDFNNKTINLDLAWHPPKKVELDPNQVATVLTSRFEHTRKALNTRHCLFTNEKGSFRIVVSEGKMQDALNAANGEFEKSKMEESNIPMRVLRELEGFNFEKSKLKTRLKNTPKKNDSLESPGKTDKDLAVSKSTNSNVAFSPTGERLVVYTTCGWDFLYIQPEQFGVIVDNQLSGLDYQRGIWLEEYIDVNKEDDIVELTADELRNLGSSNLLSIQSHSMAEGSLLCLAYFDDFDAAHAYCSNTDNTLRDDFDYTYSALNECVAVYVAGSWISEFWNMDLNNNNAIVFINACKSALNNETQSIASICGGQVVCGFLSYAWELTKGYFLQNVLKYLNGSNSNGEIRKSNEISTVLTEWTDPYNNSSSFGYYHSGGQPATLCPAISDWFPYPRDGANEVPTSCAGYIEFDTWCREVPVDDVIRFTTTGNATVSNVQWSSSDQVNRIEYEWSGNEGNQVTVHIDPTKVYSWTPSGTGGHMLDYDGVSPVETTEQSFTFTLDCMNKSTCAPCDGSGSWNGSSSGGTSSSSGGGSGGSGSLQLDYINSSNHLVLGIDESYGLSWNWEDFPYVSFTTSQSDKVSVDGTGLITGLAVTDTPATVTIHDEDGSGQYDGIYVTVTEEGNGSGEWTCRHLNAIFTTDGDVFPKGSPVIFTLPEEDDEIYQWSWYMEDDDCNYRKDDPCSSYTSYRKRFSHTFHTKGKKCCALQVFPWHMEEPGKCPIVGSYSDRIFIIDCDGKVTEKNTDAAVLHDVGGVWTWSAGYFDLKSVRNFTSMDNKHVCYEACHEIILREGVWHAATANSSLRLTANNPNLSGGNKNIADSESNFTLQAPDLLENLNTEEGDIRIYPNPTNNSFKLELIGESGKIESIDIYSSSSQHILSQTEGISRINEFNTSTWQDGIYIIRVTTSEGYVVKRLIKQ